MSFMAILSFERNQIRV